MIVFDVLAQFFVSFLLAYMALTNSWAASIESFLENGIGINEPTVVNTETSIPSPNDSSLLTTASENLMKHIPRVLLENDLFQQAALSASQDAVPSRPQKPLHTAVEESLVNIFCQLRTEDYIRTTTGSGFFVHENGVILTNAHVAQFLLLKEIDDDVVDTNCVVRMGNPASPRYEAELLYISPAWIFENAKLLSEEHPSGTGERDYALLYIARSLENEPLPATFPALSVDTALLPRSVQGAEMLTAGYPAEALFRDGPKAKLLPVLASTTVTELYTFGSNYADIFSVSSSAVGAQGASGGPIANPASGVIGLIVTKGDEILEGPRSLRAITLSYIDRTIQSETGFTLAQNMQGDLAYRGNIFKQALVPFLAEWLVNEI